jgi:hypothetical protein
MSLMLILVQGEESQEQNYYRLGEGEVEEDNGGDNLVVAKSTSYQ